MYRALYRKWRPQRFEDVVAQRGIVTALRNQVASGRVGHAYLFTGVRGTGKTTCAKIFAKAVNCLHPHNGDPCGECEICKGIDNGSILDVVEMDAASNNGVDDIRDLRDETAYTPSACHYKVYIIDEVHMLSTAAFNALLKTLEEPPAHVIFILATTEIQKVPATILSRCQRYDFTRIGPEDIAQRVEYIAGQEGLELTTGGAELISRLADGAMRDALSILDTCAGVTAKIDADVVRRMAGVTDRSYLFHISDALEAQDGAAALAQLAALRQQSVDVKRLTEELIAHYRALMLAALPGGQSLLSGVSPEEEQQYLEKGPQLGQREAIRAIRTLGSALEHMTRGSDQRIELELALFTLSEPPQAAAVPVAAMPVQTVAPAAPVVRPFVAAPVQPAPQPFMSTPAAPVEPVAAPAVEKEPAPAPAAEPKAAVPDIPESPRPQTKSFHHRPTSRRWRSRPPCPGMSRLRRSLRLYHPYRKRNQWSPLHRSHRQHLPRSTPPTRLSAAPARWPQRASIPSSSGARSSSSYRRRTRCSTAICANRRRTSMAHGCSSTAARPSGTSSVSTRTASVSSKNSSRRCQASRCRSAPTSPAPPQSTPPMPNSRSMRWKSWVWT